MGHYFMAVNLDKKEFVYTHDYDNGLKIMEHSYVGNDYMNVVSTLMRPGGDWYKNRVVWSSNYMDNEQFLNEYSPDGKIVYTDASRKYKHTLFSYAYDNFNRLKKLPSNRNFRYLVNHDLKLAVDYMKLKGYRETYFQNGKEKSITLKINPLSLLTACGHGQSSGCYNGINEDLIGTWAGHVLSFEKTLPEDVEIFEVQFLEKYKEIAT